MPAIPITIITGFLGSGKTTLILNLIPQLPSAYKLALLKNEFGDLAIDSELASSSAISGVQELLNGCICCNLVGQLGDALDTLRKDVEPDRIIVETSGSAFPATLAMEINRLGRETGNYVLDGVVVVIDVENWKGYEDTSYTARLQAKYTDLIVFNKWEGVSERRYEDCLDRIGDLELQIANVKSDNGFVERRLLLGLDSTLAKTINSMGNDVFMKEGHDHDHPKDHQSEVEVLTVILTSNNGDRQGVNLEVLEMFLLAAPKDEIYRIKAIVTASSPPKCSDGKSAESANHYDGKKARYILNWAFGRWTFTPMNILGSSTPQLANGATDDSPSDPSIRMTIITARCEADKWKKRIAGGGLIETELNKDLGTLHIERVS